MCSKRSSGGGLEGLGVELARFSLLSESPPLLAPDFVRRARHCSKALPGFGVPRAGRVGRYLGAGVARDEGWKENASNGSGWVYIVAHLIRDAQMEIPLVSPPTDWIADLAGALRTAKIRNLGEVASRRSG